MVRSHGQKYSRFRADDDIVSLIGLNVDCKPVDHIAASDDSMSDRTIDCRQAAVDSAEVSRDSAAFLLVDYARRSSDESSIND